MATKTQTLDAQTRTKAGSTDSRGLRHAGNIPGILFGHAAASVAIVFDAKAFEELLNHGGKSQLLALTIDGANQETVLIREIQRDPVSRRVIHADLQRVDARESVAARLPIVTVGVADGVKNFGGVMDVVIREIEVEGPADGFPESLSIDVTNLGLRDHIVAREVPLPAGFKLVTAPETMIVAIEPSRTAGETEAAAAPAATDVPTVAETAGENPT